MKPLDRNISVLEHIVSYCQQIEQTMSDSATAPRLFRMTPSTATLPLSVSCKSVNW